MNLSIATENFELNDNLLSAIVRAIEKAVTEDVPSQLREMPLETTNYIAHMRGDFINQNLRDFATEEGGQLHSFHRFVWNGRVLICHENRLAISVMTQTNLRLIPKKARRRPHFVQSMVHSMNGDLQARFEQTKLFDTDPFEPQEYARDCQDIFNGALNMREGYRHCVIAYQARGNELLDVKLMVLSPQFDPIIEKSLNDYMKPDFAKLTNSTSFEEVAQEEHNLATHRLTSLKRGVKPILREGEKQA